MMLEWESVNTACEDRPGEVFVMRRAKVPGGWLVTVGVGSGGGLAFYPDPQHRWDGSSLPKRTLAKKSRVRSGKAVARSSKRWTYAQEG